MFCSTCGNQVNPGLRFCNSCGARLKRSNPWRRGSSLPSINLIVSFILAMPLAGLGILLALLVVMKKALDFREDMIFAIATMTFFLLLISEIGLIVLMIARIRAGRRNMDEEDDDDESPDHLPNVVMRGLGAGQPQPAREAVSSVTEHTTRTLSHVPRDTDRFE